MRIFEVLNGSQMRAVPSEDAVTIRDPSGLNAALVTPFSCPVRQAISAPLDAFQTASREGGVVIGSFAREKKIRRVAFL